MCDHFAADLGLQIYHGIIMIIYCFLNGRTRGSAHLCSGSSTLHGGNRHGVLVISEKGNRSDSSDTVGVDGDPFIVLVPIAFVVDSPEQQRCTVLN